MAAAHEAGLTSVVAAPLYARGELLGVMSLALSRLTHREDRNYSAPDRDLIGAIASRVAVAIDNSMLFETVHALDVRLAGIADAAMDLDGFGYHAVDHFAGVELGFGSGGSELLGMRIFKPGSMIDQAAGSFDLRLHVGKHPLDGLELADGLAEAARLRPGSTTGWPWAFPIQYRDLKDSRWNCSMLATL